MAAELAGGAGAVLSYRSAGQLRGVLPRLAGNPGGLAGDGIQGEAGDSGASRCAAG